MNIYLKKRKNQYLIATNRLVASICLNSLSNQAAEYEWQEALVVTNYENSWIEQSTEVKSDISPINQTQIKQSKFISKWWENN